MTSRSGDAGRLDSDGRRALDALSASLSEVSERVGVSRSSVSEWRNGWAFPGDDARSRMEAAYGIPASSWGQTPKRVRRDRPTTAAAMARIEARIAEKVAQAEATLDRGRSHSSPAERAAAVKMAREGASLAAVARALGRSVHIVRAWCRAGGWTRGDAASKSPLVLAIANAEAPAAPVDGAGAVYFLAAESVDRVKVGFTQDNTTITGRMSALAYSSPVPVTLMKVIAGSMQGERWLHAKWAEHRHHGEWFTLSAIRADIEAMESARDVSAEVEAAKACADCGIYRKGAKRGQVRCRACARKRGHEERARMREATRAHITEVRCPCGTEISKANTSGLCRPCAMRKAWGTDEYRAAIMPSRQRQRVAS